MRRSCCGGPVRLQERSSRVARKGRRENQRSRNRKRWLCGLGKIRRRRGRHHWRWSGWRRTDGTVLGNGQRSSYRGGTDVVRPLLQPHPRFARREMIVPHELGRQSPLGIVIELETPELMRVVDRAATDGAESQRHEAAADSLPESHDGKILLRHSLPGSLSATHRRHRLGMTAFSPHPGRSAQLTVAPWFASFANVLPGRQMGETPRRFHLGVSGDHTTSTTVRGRTGRRSLR